MIDETAIFKNKFKEKLALKSVTKYKSVQSMRMPVCWGYTVLNISRNDSSIDQNSLSPSLSRIGKRLLSQCDMMSFNSKTSMECIQNYIDKTEV